MPLNQAVAFAEPFALGEANRSAMMVSHDAVDAPARKQKDRGVIAESAISQNDVAGIEKVPERSEQESFRERFCAFGDPQHHARAQTEQRHDLHQREPAAAPLTFELGVKSLIFRRVRHGNPGPIHDLDVTPTPEPFSLGPRRHPLDDLRAGAVEVLLAQAGARLAVSRSIGRRGLPLLQGQPSQKFSHHLPARPISRKHLRQKQPKGP